MPYTPVDALEVRLWGKRIGAVALEERVVLTELSAGGAGSLEEMFLELTAATSREGAAA